MREVKGRARVRNALLLLTSMMLVASAVVPTLAAAAAIPKSTLLMSTIYMPTAKSFTISGRISSSLKGKRMVVEIRKPGRTFWTAVGSPLISKSGTWSLKYSPKLGGKFFVRARYSKGYSRTGTLTVKKGPRPTTLLLASTTSTRDSGLWEALKPLFRAQCPEYSVKATFVGSGAAMALGGSGDADVLLVHSPAAELDFMKGIVAGAKTPYKGLTRYKVMYNDFILVGPKSDPANISISESAKTAFGKINSSNSPFWSRNDASGTNAKELSIWKSLGDPQKGQSWYKASGTMGMAQALAACDENSAYTLADRGTWLNWLNLQPFVKDANGKDTKVKDVKIEIVNQGDPTYFNQYSVIEVAKAKNWEGAQDFRRWIMSPAAQSIIREYGIDTFDQALFKPNAGTY